MMKPVSEIRAKLHEYDLGRVADEISALLRPCVRLVTEAASGELHAMHTRIGGMPALPPSRDWPSRNGRPLSFLGQVNLSQIAELGLDLGLPERGMLGFYLDEVSLAESGWTPDGARVVHFEDEGTARATPDGVHEYRACSVTLVPSWSLPAMSSSCPFIYQLGLEGDEDDAYQDFASMMDEHLGAPPGHQLCGYGDVHDGDMHVDAELDTSPRREELQPLVYPLGSPRTQSEELDAVMASARTWRLLMQFVEDDSAEMGWWERGIAFLLRQDAFAAARLTDAYWRLA
ncbi:MAG: YwqG family protein [Polyangiaceae bacterium]